MTSQIIPVLTLDGRFVGNIVNHLPSTRRPLGDVASASVASTLPGCAGAHVPDLLHGDLTAASTQEDHHGR